MKRSFRGRMGWFLKMAWRDGYASRRRLFLFMASIVLGIAAIVAIQSFSYSVRQNITNQSKVLLGADFVIDSRKPANEKVQKIIDSIEGDKARESNFASMVAFPSTGATRLVNVRALEGNFPYYGELTTTPESAARNFQKEGKALVDATVMLQFGIEPGDSIKVGNLTFAIAGGVSAVPGQSGISASVAPPVFIPLESLEETGLLQKGSRIEYNYYFKIANDVDVDKLEDKLNPILDKEEADIDTHASIGRRTTRGFENFGRFLNIVAFTALLLGCIGVASAVNIYIKEKLTSVAILRCVGATRLQTFLIYLFQVAMLGLIGAVIGTVLGIAIQQIFPVFLQEFIAVEIEVAYSLEAMFMGVVLGLTISVLFALLPLLSIWDVSPLRALRIVDSESASTLMRRIAVLTAIFLFILLFSYWQLTDWKYSAIFTGGILFIFALLTGMGAILMYAVKRFFPVTWSFSARQSLLNLYRPNNQTLILVVAIGIGSFLIGTLYFTKDMLLSKISLDSGSNDPNIIIFDIQNDQVDQVKSTVKSQDNPVLQHVPIVTMRLHSLRGKEVTSIKEDTASGIDDWVLNREYRVTFRDSLIDSEALIEGEWKGEASNGGEKINISIEKGLAESMKAEIGDELVFNVQGVLLKTFVGSVRDVDWRRLQTNFLVVFPTGALEDAPQFHVVTTKVPDNLASAKLQQALVQGFPNVSIVDLRQILATVEDIIGKISNVITFMAFFSILTGIVVLIGAVRTSKYQRITESVLLRTLGASKKQILKITAMEYFFLGCFASITGILLSFLSSALLASFSFETVFIPSLWPALLIFSGITLLSVIIGLLNSRSVISSPPLEVLRKEG